MPIAKLKERELAKKFDSTTKQLIQAHPADWLRFAGLPLGDSITVVDADVSSFSAAADKVIRVEGLLSSYIAHFEFQAGHDLTLDRRILLYNVLLRWRHNLPVRSVVILLRPEAAPAGVLGCVLDAGWSEGLLDFRYKMVRVWEQSPESILSGGLGTLPLATISAVAMNDLPEVIRKVETRFAKEAPAEARDLETATYILLGLRHDKEMIRNILTGVRHMKESVTYQAILEEGEALGEARGEARGERNAFLRIATKKLGPPSVQARKAIDAMTDLPTIDRMIERVLDVSSWEQLFTE